MPDINPYEPPEVEVEQAPMRFARLDFYRHLLLIVSVLLMMPMSCLFGYVMFAVSAIMLTGCNPYIFFNPELLDPDYFVDTLKKNLTYPQGFLCFLSGLATWVFVFVLFCQVNNSLHYVRLFAAKAENAATDDRN